jgi:hypothetical protein
MLFLDENGVDPMAEDKDQSTLLHQASQHRGGNEWLLVEHNVIGATQDEHESALLHQASRWGNGDFKRLFLFFFLALFCLSYFY